MASSQKFAEAKANRERATLEICRLIGIPKHEAAAGVGKGNNTLSVHKRTTASGVGEVKYRLSQCC